MSEITKSSWSVPWQERVTHHIRKLAWLEERMGDQAKYQGFDQAEVESQIIKHAICLRLVFMAIEEDIP